MFGTKDLFVKSGKVHDTVSQQSGEKHEHITPHHFLYRLFKQSKQVSQIIAYIWRWADAIDNPKKDIANKLKEYFINPTDDLDHPGGKLEKLLKADPKNSDPEAKLLYAVFFEDSSSDNKDLLFPMFSDDECDCYSFQINVNSFDGKLCDPTPNDPGIIAYNIPYPPRPCIGETTVTEYELEQWIKNRDKKKSFADNPYIPTTCS
ncbi:hypothetical protein A6S26_22005 [Nostoc sp. ATCC 43529]|nr:hypothetical protein A6S26_22005 [Nostoc sp. ATCC 43529]